LELNKDIAKRLATFEGKVLSLGQLKLTKLVKAVWGFTYTFICQNRPVELGYFSGMDNKRKTSQVFNNNPQGN